AELVGAGRRPARLVAAHRDEDEAEATHRGGRRLRRGRQGGDHRVQQRQRECGPGTTKKRPPRQRLLQDDHGLLLIWNGVLVTMASISAAKRWSAAFAARTTSRTAGPS